MIGFLNFLTASASTYSTLCRCRFFCLSWCGRCFCTLFICSASSGSSSGYCIWFWKIACSLCISLVHFCIRFTACNLIEVTYLVHYIGKIIINCICWKHTHWRLYSIFTAVLCEKIIFSLVNSGTKHNREQTFNSDLFTKQLSNQLNRN